MIRQTGPPRVTLGQVEHLPDVLELVRRLGRLYAEQGIKEVLSSTTDTPRTGSDQKQYTMEEKLQKRLDAESIVLLGDAQEVRHVVVSLYREMVRRHL
jgi:hypothetical protein